MIIIKNYIFVTFLFITPILYINYQLFYSFFNQPPYNFIGYLLNMQHLLNKHLIV